MQSFIGRPPIDSLRGPILRGSKRLRQLRTLRICHDIVVKQHGGSIEVDTQPGEFTEIKVILPRVAALLPERS